RRSFASSREVEKELAQDDQISIDLANPAAVKLVRDHHCVLREQGRITASNHIERAVQHSGRRIERAVGVQRSSKLEVRAESRYRGERRCNLGDGSWIEQTVGVV